MKPAAFIFIPMDLLNAYKTHWQEAFGNLAAGNCQLLLAVSGGVDSVVLVDLVAATGFSFEIVHCNFQLRGTESARDEMFVRELGERYGKKTLVRNFETAQYATERKCAIQEAARDLRYAWFAEIVDQWKEADSKKAAYIVTAHHADDNIETMLMHFFRGTGINGLTGIPAIQVDRGLIRPLLPFRKTQLLEYAAVQGLSFVEDSSNASDKYTRNFFRNQLIPQIKEVFPQVEENLLHNIGRMKEVAELYQQSVRQQLKKLLEQKGEEWHVPVIKWKRVQPLHTISWELIKPFGFTAQQTGEVIKLLDAANGSHIASPTHRIIHNRNWMIISPAAAETAQHILVEEADKSVPFAGGFLEIKITGQPVQAISTEASEAMIDAAFVQFPLLLRKYQTGDYFYPLGMQKKKKVSRFLIDQKLSKTDKEKVWVLESNRKIVWVIGYRIDDRFKLTAGTKKTVHFIYRK
ncbi:MAG: tilS [Sediminibacterium sp.]|nr:tilS [Sediminibacterium sp.]